MQQIPMGARTVGDPEPVRRPTSIAFAINAAARVLKLCTGPQARTDSATTFSILAGSCWGGAMQALTDDIIALARPRVSAKP